LSLPGDYVGAAVKITQTDHMAANLRGWATKCRDTGQSRRLLAIAMVLDGATRLEAAQRTTLILWDNRCLLHKANGDYDMG
jgi:putative transposase